MVRRSIMAVIAFAAGLVALFYGLSGRIVSDAQAEKSLLPFPRRVFQIYEDGSHIGFDPDLVRDEVDIILNATFGGLRLVRREHVGVVGDEAFEELARQSKWLEFTYNPKKEITGDEPCPT